MNGTESAERVLLIDDDELISGALYRELVDRGCEVYLATEPGAAESLLKERDYALVLVDAYLTGQLHERAAALLDCVLSMRGLAHVLLVTAYGAGLLEQRLRGVASATLVNKPVPVWMLIELVSGFLSIRQQKAGKCSPQGNTREGDNR
ncbi:MAG: hypothetical protein ACSLFQ_14110 [Thermoanaerobaculia bacterium]